MVSLGCRNQTRRVRSAPHIDRISRRRIRPARHLPVSAGGVTNSGFSPDFEQNIFDFNSARRDINENYGVSLTQVRDQIRDISGVHYDSKLKKITFPSDPKTTPQMLFCETYLSGDDSDNQSGDFDRSKSKSCRTDKEQNSGEVGRTPVQQYDPFNMEPFLLLIGGKTRKPVFKRSPIRTWKVYL